MILPANAFVVINPSTGFLHKEHVCHRLRSLKIPHVLSQVSVVPPATILVDAVRVPTFLVPESSGSKHI